MNVTGNDDELNSDADLPEGIRALLAEEHVWTPSEPGLDELIVASIISEAEDSTSGASMSDASMSDDSMSGEGQVKPGSANEPQIATVTQLRRWRTVAVAAAAALVLLGGLVGITQLRSESSDFEVAMAGTDLAPDASATAEITDTPEGTRIVIEVEDLPPAAPGTYYQAWLRVDGEIGVSAGTFHLRSGEGPIELWAGVSTDDYPLLTVTIQEEAQTESSGRVVLKVLIDADE